MKKQTVFGGPNHEVEFPTDTSIENFNYNGFGCESLKGFADYQVVSLIEWTLDPGIGKFKCSDDQDRLIPSCQLTTAFLNTQPKSVKLQCFGPDAKGLLFGESANS